MDSTKQYIREAYHAGSWYQSEPTLLNATLTNFISSAQNDLPVSSSTTIDLPRGLIAPHAGFSYSGPTAAYAYLALSEALQKSWRGTVVVLHPSHHAYLDGCAISGATSIFTPLGNIQVDEALRAELLNTREFTIMTKETDEKEHSGEMQYPFIQKALLDSNKDDDGEDTGSQKLRILPIMIGAVSTGQEQHFGKLFAPFLSRENVFTVVSSDFCHWGRRFGYTPTSPPGHIKTPSSVKDIYQYVSFILVLIHASSTSKCYIH
jgi:AmmeMemoRadiSam system protein B